MAGQGRVDGFQDLKGTGRAMGTTVVKLVKRAVPTSLFPVGGFIVVDNILIRRGKAEELAIIVVRIAFCRARTATLHQYASSKCTDVFKIRASTRPRVVRNRTNSVVIESVVQVGCIHQGIRPKINRHLR